MHGNTLMPKNWKLFFSACQELLKMSAGISIYPRLPTTAGNPDSVKTEDQKQEAISSEGTSQHLK